MEIKLTRQQNIFLAKKSIIENIYHSAKLEGCNVTFPETYTIYNGINVSDVSLDDIQCILNLRNAWKFLLNNIDEPTNVDYLCKLNSFVSQNESLEWGVLRKGKVGIGGTDYQPPIPKKEIVEKELSKILTDPDASITEKSIIACLWGMKNQLFWDGNKRTGMLLGNKILIEHGCGILSVRDKDILEFNKLLTAYYNDDLNLKHIKEFMLKNCIFGIEFEKSNETETINEEPSALVDKKQDTHNGRQASILTHIKEAKANQHKGQTQVKGSSHKNER